MGPIDQAFSNLQNSMIYAAQMKRQREMDAMAMEDRASQQKSSALAMLLQQKQMEEYDRKVQMEEDTRGAYRQASTMFDAAGAPTYPLARPGISRDSFLEEQLGTIGNYDHLRQVRGENEARQDKNLGLLFQAAQANKPSYQNVGNDMYQVPGDPTLLRLLQGRGITMPGQPQQAQAPGVSLPSIAGMGIGQDPFALAGSPPESTSTGPKKVISGPKKAPQSRTRNVGGTEVFEEFDEAAGKWVQVSTGPRWNPRPPKTDKTNPRDEMALRKEFNALPEVKTWKEMQQQLGRVDKAMFEANRGGSLIAADQALITILNKALDPSSVVRESEYARTPENMALINRVMGKGEKIMRGGAGLTSDERKALYTMVKNFADVAEGLYNEQSGEYASLAERYGYSPGNIVGSKKSPPKKGGNPTQTSTRKSIGGKTYVNRNGQWYEE